MGGLFLIRHGQASFGKENYDLISGLGIRQASIVGDYFRESGIVFDAVHSGTLSRHVATAETITSSAGHEIFPAASYSQCFNEFDAEGIFRGYLPVLVEKEPDLAAGIDSVFSDNRAFQKVFSKLVGLWLSGLYEVDGVESWDHFLQRVYSGLGMIAGMNAGSGNAESAGNSDNTGNIAVVTSGGVIAAVMKKALGLDDEAAIGASWKCLNCSVSVFDFQDFQSLQDGMLTLREFNGVGHFETLNDKGLLTYR